MIVITSGDFEIFKLIKQGLSNQEIADELYLKKKTVQNRLARMYKKCQINNRNKLAAFNEDDFVIGRQRSSIYSDKLPEVKKLHSQGLGATAMATRLNVTRSTIYNYLKKL